MFTLGIYQVSQILYRLSQELTLLEVGFDAVLLQAFQYFLQCCQVFCVIRTSNHDVVNVAHCLGYVLQNGVHGLLKDRRGRGNTKGQSLEAVQSLVCVDGRVRRPTRVVGTPVISPGW